MTKGRWKVLRPPRAATLTVVAGLAAAACAPADRASGPRAVLADGAGGSARVITTLHVVQPGAVVATAGYADTTTAPVTVGDGSAAIDVAVLTGRPRTPSSDDYRLFGSRPGAASVAGGALEIARDDRRPNRQGRWTQQRRLADGRVAELELSAEHGAPVSRRTLRVGGEVVLTDQTAWRRVDGVWRVEARTVTAFRGGRAVGWAESRIELPALRSASAAERLRFAVASAGRVGVAAVSAAADALAPAPLMAQTGTNAMPGPCGKQAETTLDALDAYLNADFLFGAAVLSGNPFAAVAAFANLLSAAHKVDVAEDRLDACVAAA